MAEIEFDALLQRASSVNGSFAPGAVAPPGDLVTPSKRLCPRHRRLQGRCRAGAENTPAAQPPLRLRFSAKIELRFLN